MRKRLSEWAIVSAALLLCVFSLGFFFGRNQANRNDTLVQVSRSAPKTQDELPESASAKSVVTDTDPLTLRGGRRAEPFSASDPPVSGENVTCIEVGGTLYALPVR